VVRVAGQRALSASCRVEGTLPEERT